MVVKTLKHNTGSTKIATTMDDDNYIAAYSIHACKCTYYIDILHVYPCMV